MSGVLIFAWWGARSEQKQRQIEKASTILLEASAVTTTSESSVTTSSKNLQQKEEKSEKPSKGITKSITEESFETNFVSPESKKQEPSTEKEQGRYGDEETRSVGDTFGQADLSSPSPLLTQSPSHQISQSPSVTSETPPVIFQAIGEMCFKEARTRPFREK